MKPCDPIIIALELGLGWLYSSWRNPENTSDLEETLLGVAAA